MKMEDIEKKQTKQAEGCEKKHFIVDKKYDKAIEKLTDTNLKLERVTTILELYSEKFSLD